MKALSEGGPPHAGDVLISLREASMHFGPFAAPSGCTLNITRGERVALVGSNGSGKSTLLRLIHGLLPASGGLSLRPQAAPQAMLFQRPYMLRTSAQNNVALGLWMAGAGWRAAREQALAAVAPRIARLTEAASLQRAAASALEEVDRCRRAAAGGCADNSNANSFFPSATTVAVNVLSVLRCAGSFWTFTVVGGVSPGICL
jgi:tungstate transport system ATP-binding protein